MVSTTEKKKQDTVEWGSLFVGCAGGGDSLITLPVEQDVVDPESFDSYRQERTALAIGSSLRVVSV